MIEPIIKAILEKVKLLLRKETFEAVCGAFFVGEKTVGDEGIEGEILLIYCEQAYQEACGICNVKNMPEESVSNIAFLCVANLTAQNNQTIQSLSEGGRSVSFGNMNAQQLRDKALTGLKKWKKVRAI